MQANDNSLKKSLDSTHHKCGINSGDSWPKGFDYQGYFCRMFKGLRFVEVTAKNQRK